MNAMECHLLHLAVSTTPSLDYRLGFCCGNEEDVANFRFDFRAKQRYGHHIRIVCIFDPKAKVSYSATHHRGRGESHEGPHEEKLQKLKIMYQFVTFQE